MTDPAAAVWGRTDPRYRRFETTVRVGADDDAPRLSDDVLRWRVKTRSGFTVAPDSRVEVGARPVIVARPFGVAIREPVEVVAVVDEPDRAGFAYRTLPGHPVSGEEAFIVHRDRNTTLLTIRSLTLPCDSLRWRLLFPALLVAQRVARRRYLAALR